jgi:CheY-like chemotaxis protein
MKDHLHADGSGQHHQAKAHNPAMPHAAHQAGVAAALRRSPAGQGAIAILLVDDDPDCRLFIRDAITESKVSNSVYEVADGQEALGFLRRQGEWAGAPRPGLVYLDIEMPGMNGLDVLKEIKSDADLRDIPVVMMTGVSDERHMLLAAELGANSYTIKPANAVQFLQTVLASTNYWLTIHQYPHHHLPPEECRR